MWTSKAQGGPLDNVVLTAGPSWDGRVREPSTSAKEGAVIRYHPGRYVWLRVKHVWTWDPAEPMTINPAAQRRGVYVIRARKPQAS
jgi:hypothetical protein